MGVRMNANELADELHLISSQKKDLLEKSVTMLRQQADLIRNLQKSLGFKNSGYETINLTPSKELTDEDIAKVVHELNQKANTPERWVTAMQIGAETIIQLRDELRKVQKND